MYHISTATGTGSAGAFSFSSIPQNFTHLQLRISAREVGTSNVLFHYFNGDFAATNYTWTTFSAQGTAAAVGSGGPSGFFNTQAHPSNSELANTNGVVIIDILDYSNTSKAKTIKMLGGYNLGSTPGYLAITGGTWNSTAAINSYVLTPGFSTNSRADLYGLTTSSATGA